MNPILPQYGLLLTGMLCAATSASAGELTDGRDILLKSLTTYTRMTSYDGRSNTDSIIQDSSGHSIKQSGTSCEMKFKRPNKLRLDFATPLGSRTIWSNSTDFGVYDLSTRKYWIVPTAPTMETLIPLLFKQANTSAYFDPLYGLCRSTIPAQLADFRLKASSTYNGHPVYVVTATMRTPKPSDWTWWVDRNTLLLYKIEQVTRNLDQKVMVVEDGKQVQKTRHVNLLIRNIVTDAKPNAQIADSDFQFQPPPGATVRIDPSNLGGKH